MWVRGAEVGGDGEGADGWELGAGLWVEEEGVRGERVVQMNLWGRWSSLSRVAIDSEGIVRYKVQYCNHYTFHAST